VVLAVAVVVGLASAVPELLGEIIHRIVALTPARPAALEVLVIQVHQETLELHQQGSAQPFWAEMEEMADLEVPQGLGEQAATAELVRILWITGQAAPMSVVKVSAAAAASAVVQLEVDVARPGALIIVLTQAEEGVVQVFATMDP
jgi:hypothetical protein